MRTRAAYPGFSPQPRWQRQLLPGRMSVSATHRVFSHGFLHPIGGLDHVLANARHCGRALGTARLPMADETQSRPNKVGTEL